MASNLSQSDMRGWRGNPLLVASLALGVLAAVLPWAYSYHEVGDGVDVGTLLDVLVKEPFDELRLSAVLFCVGLIAILLTPLGGFVQLAGATTAMATAPHQYEGLPLLHPGELLAFLAASLAILSIWFPDGNLFRRRKANISKGLAYPLAASSDANRLGHSRPRLQLNIISFAGIVIGAAALFMEWYSFSNETPSVEGFFTPESWMGGGLYALFNLSPTFGLVVGLYASGLIFAVITPLSATLQGIALVLAGGTLGGSGVSERVPEVGLVLAIISLAAIALGGVAPFWVSRDGRVRSKRTHLLTFDVDHAQAAAVPEHDDLHGLRAIPAKLNIICVVGALVGILAIFEGLFELGTSDYTLVGWIVFAVGTLGAFVTPWSGFAQLFGLTLYDIYWGNWYGYPHLAVFVSYTSFNFYLAAASCLLVLSALFLGPSAVWRGSSFPGWLCSWRTR